MNLNSRVIYVHDDKYWDVSISTATGSERFACNQNNQKTLYVTGLEIRPSTPMTRLEIRCV